MKMAIIFRLLLFIVLPALSANGSSWEDLPDSTQYNQTSGTFHQNNSLDLPTYISTASETTETESTTISVIHHAAISLDHIGLVSFLNLTASDQSLPHHILAYLSLFSNSPPA